MIPFLYPTRSTAFPVLIIANQNQIEDDDDGEEEEHEEDFTNSSMGILSRIVPIPITALSNFVNTDEQISPPSSTHNDHENIFRLRLNVDDFQPNELNISIRHGRLIVRGKHVVRVHTQSSQPLTTTNSIINGNDDIEADFVAKEFKRTFIIPSNIDVRKAHAQFYPEQQLLVIEIPSQIRTNGIRIRSIDVFLAIIIILSMDRAIRRTYEQFMMNEQQSTNTSSQNTNRRRRENHNIFF